MKKIKTYIQFPWKASDSTYYKYLRYNPALNIEYSNIPQNSLIQSRNKLKINNFFKKIVKFLLRKFYPSMPNIHYTKNPNKYDLIHCAHCLSRNKMPWVADIEFVGQFWASGPWKDYPSKKKVRKYVKSEYCKKILAWSEWSKKGILKEFPEIKEKVEIVYPAVPLKKRKRKKGNEIRILFVGRDFYLKGGAIALKIMDELTKKYVYIKGIVISDTPREIINKYKKNSKLKFYKLMPQEKLFNEIYPKSDILIYPTFSDTFGFAILEAQSFGLPVIAMKTQSTHTINETIDNGKTGFVIDNLKANAYQRIVSDSVLNKIKDKTEALISDKKLLKSMSNNCLKLFKDGKFSIKKRNEKLKRIYSEAIR